MPETQKHGFDFENWIKDTFFAKSHIKYTEKWDVPIELNISNAIPSEFQRLPVSIKTCKFGGSIGFGDAVRQFENDEDFLLIVGFWQQDGGNKNFISVVAAKVTAEQWHKLFETLIENDDVRKLDALIKDRSKDYWEVRKQAKEAKKSDRVKSAMMVLNPKIDSKNQRRLQCSLPFNLFWSNIAKSTFPAQTDKNKKKECELFGVKLPNPFLSSPRIFNT